MPVPSGYHAPGGQQGPSCFKKLQMGFMLGATVGSVAGVIIGTFMTMRMGLRGREMMKQIGRTAAQSAGSFGVFMAVAQGIRC